MKKYKLLIFFTFSLLINNLLTGQETKNEYLIKKFGLPENAYDIFLSEDSVPVQWSFPTETPGVVGVTVGGKPPKHYRAPVAQPTDGSVILNNVPAFDWSFGCSATSAAMLVGYYDNMGLPDMYTGPTNNGLMPMDNSSWGTVIINGETRSQCPLSATRFGVDGRTIFGHVDDYWVSYGSTAPDPFISGGWTQHSYGDCTGDYMKTSQSNHSNKDGTTTFYFGPDGGIWFLNSEGRDGGFGLSEFISSRGYNAFYFNQKIVELGLEYGFSYDQYVAEINYGRPVLIHVIGHTMLGVGYNTNGNKVYLHDTWDYELHEMVWGGVYFNGDDPLQHTGVTVMAILQALPYNIVLDQPNTSGTYNASNQITLASGFTSGTSFTATVWQPNDGAFVKILYHEKVMTEFEIKTAYRSIYPDLWDGTDASGNKVEPGFYQYVISKDGNQVEQGVVLVK